jgi:hypothetical protein
MTMREAGRADGKGRGTDRPANLPSVLSIQARLVSLPRWRE